MNSERLALTIMYIRDQQMYLEEHREKFHLLADWMLEGENVEYLPHDWPLADVCGRCGYVFSRGVRGGHVTYGCYDCVSNKLPFEKHVLRYIYPPMLAEILRVSECVLESYLASAIAIIKETSSLTELPA